MTQSRWWRGAAGLVLAGAIAGTVLPAAWGQQTPQQPPPVKDPAAVTLHGAESSTTHSWTTDQLLTSTVHEAWVLSGRNKDQFFDMVKELATMSAQKRGLTLPETEASGAKAGQMIKREAKRDPDQLLYAVVDRAVIKTATKTGASAAP